MACFSAAGFIWRDAGTGRAAGDLRVQCSVRLVFGSVCGVFTGANATKGER